MNKMEQAMFHLGKCKITLKFCYKTVLALKLW